MDKKWYQKTSNWLTIIASIILIPILLINCSIIYQAHTDSDKVPSVFGYKPFIVLSASMETEIRQGDLIIAKEVNPKTLKKGDIIAFRDNENTVTTHRIIDLVDDDDETYFVTKGDNNDSQDQKLVEYKDVEGEYQLRIPLVGNILNALAEPTIIIILVLGITIIFGIGFYTSTKKEREKEHEEFLAYKKQKEEEEEAEKLEKENSTKKTSTSPSKNTTKKSTSVKKNTTKKEASNKSSNTKSSNKKSK